MKRFPLILIVLIACAAMTGDAQTRRKGNAKRTTIVDSISAPPRMDGNTGKYDTVRPRRKPARNPKKKSGSDYQYRISSDTIGVQPKR